MSHTIGAGSPVNYVWDVNRSMPEILQDGTNSYVYGLGRISSIDGSGNQTYYTGDGLGSTTDLTNSSAMRIDGYTYDAFGAPTHSPGSSTQPFQFTGQQTDAESGLQYLRARYYDPSTGRLLGRDPLSGSSSSSASQNRYTYALNNPTTFSDPTGQFSLIDLINGLRPAFTCTLGDVTHTDFGCIGDFLSQIDAYNQFVRDVLSDPLTWTDTGQIVGQFLMVACQPALAPAGGLISAGLCSAGLSLYVTSSYLKFMLLADGPCEKGVVAATTAGGLLPLEGKFAARVGISVADGAIRAILCPSAAEASDRQLPGSGGKE